MNDAQKVALGILSVACSVAFGVFTWQHNIWGMVGAFVALLLITIVKD